ncbi:MAG: DUF3450 family protein [Alphaproteobacteria bacterium]|nr:DUF3450 family protein [Alphaproteobacteria bacterium]
MPTCMTLALLLVGGVAHADDASDLAQRLSDLRTDVEGLSETLELEQDALKSELRTSELRKAELESRIRAEELRLQELERLVAKQREILSADAVADEVLGPVIADGIARLRREVEAGLPYRVQERLDGLDQLANQVQAGTLDPRRAVGRLWQFVEDELRLTRENILDRQVVQVDGKDTLVRVARLGMIGLFYRTDDGRYGQAVRTASGWSWTPLTDPDDVERLDALYDALGKQIRVGWFDLPWALPEVTR